MRAFVRFPFSVFRGGTKVAIIAPRDAPLHSDAPNGTERPANIRSAAVGSRVVTRSDDDHYIWPWSYRKTGRGTPCRLRCLDPRIRDRDNHQ